MCGIACIVDPVNNIQSDIEPMIDSMHHRGPDGRGSVFTGPAGLGMCRLSIIDLSGGQQPIANEDETVQVVCNGEIYNHEELRQSLQAKGHRFRTGSDVEVIVHLYEEHGDDFLSHLRGMFGLAVWDQKRRRLVVARDRVGIKPIFYSVAGERLMIASEIKALLSSKYVTRRLDSQALDDFFTLGYIPSPRTIFKDISKLEPGHSLVWENGKIKIQRYWKFSFDPISARSEDDWLIRLEHEFRQAVKCHLMSEVPIGAFLSGGIDSGLLVAIMSQESKSRVKTFSIGFGGKKGSYLDERPYAQMVSARYGTDHTELEVEPALDQVMEPIVRSFDEPFADDSVVPSYYLYGLARKQVTVGLSGLGGDELFGGYERYLGFELSRHYDRAPRWMQSTAAKMVDRLPELASGHPAINHLKRFVRSGQLSPTERYNAYVTIFDREKKRRLYSQQFASNLNSSDSMSPSTLRTKNFLDHAVLQDVETYLPEDILALSDRLSMASSLEVRVPFVDHAFMEFCARIPANLKIKGFEKKYLLRKLAARFLPEPVMNHRKQGFASPMASWFRNDLRGYVRESLSPAALKKHGLFDSNYVESLLQSHQQLKESCEKQLFTLLMFQKWFDHYKPQI